MNQNIQTEVDASYLYQKLADNEPEETVANVFRQMSAIERSHAEAFINKHYPDGKLPFPPPFFQGQNFKQDR